MTANVFTKNDRLVSNDPKNKRVYTVVTGTPDVDGDIVALTDENRYIVLDPGRFRLAPKRYTVEIRPPRKGDEYIVSGGMIEVADFDSSVPQPVLIEVAS